MKPTGRPPILTNRIIEEVTKAGQDGIDSRQIFDAIARDITAQSIRSTLSRLVTCGRIFGDSNSTRKYFIRKEWAEASPVKSKLAERHWSDKFSEQLVNDCLSLVKQSGADGISNDVAAQILLRNNRTIQTIHGRMLRNGEIFIGRVGNHHKYFSTQEYADAYSDKQKKRQGRITRKRVEAKKPKQTKPKTAQEMMPKRLGTTAVAADKKVSWANEQAVYPDGVKHIKLEAPRGRFEPTGEEPYFSSLQIGSYKPSESAISRAYG